MKIRFVSGVEENYLWQGNPALIFEHAAPTQTLRLCQDARAKHISYESTITRLSSSACCQDWEAPKSLSRLRGRSVTSEGFFAPLRIADCKATAVCKRSVMYVTLSKTSCRFDHSHKQVMVEHQTLDKRKLKELCSVWPRYRDVKRAKSRPCRQSGIHHPVRQLVSADHDQVPENSLSVYSSFDMLDKSDKRRVMRR
jgi:hypothetical protein